MRGIGESLFDLVKPIGKWVFQNVFKEKPLLVILAVILLIVVVYTGDRIREREW